MDAAGTTPRRTPQMMFAYQRNRRRSRCNHLADGTPGRNGIDIVDEIYWGLKWLDKMNPEPGDGLMNRRRP